MLVRRSVVVALVVATAVTATRLAGPTQAGHARVSRALACGTERWIVKTLQDRPRLIRAQTTTVAHLVGLVRPRPAPVTRSQFERHIYVVEAAVTEVLSEADQDLHVVLEVGNKHMIAESPNAPFCTVQATPTRKKQMVNARSLVRVCAKARVSGVVFWDHPHRVTGRAPNAIELHPILDFVCLR